MPNDDAHATRDAGAARHEARGEAPQATRRDTAPSPAASPEGKQEEGKRRSPLIWVVLGAIALVALAGGIYWWWSGRNLESTDDAFTDGNVVMVAAKVSGYVTQLAVTDNQRVEAGEVLLRIDPRDYQAARDQAAGRVTSAEAQLASARAQLEIARGVYPARLEAAKAQRDAAQATLDRAEADLRRQQGLRRGATTQAEVDQATAAAAQARAQLEQAVAALHQAQTVQQNIAQAEAQLRQDEGDLAQARAQLHQAEVNLSYCTLVAPQAGTVTKRNVVQGQFINAGAALMSVVEPKVWVTANFKEGQLTRMRQGEAVRISVDAYPQLKLRGHVDSIQMGTGSRFSAFPAENATGNFVKIVQRVPVKIDIDSGLDPNIPLPLGLSVVPTVQLE